MTSFTGYGLLYFDRLKSTLSGPDKAGILYLAITPLVCYYFSQHKGRGRFWFGVGLALLLQVLMLATGSRIARLCSIFLYLWLLLDKETRKLMLVLLPCAAVAFYFMFFYRSIGGALHHGPNVINSYIHDSVRSADLKNILDHLSIKRVLLGWSSSNGFGTSARVPDGFMSLLFLRGGIFGLLAFLFAYASVVGRFFLKEYRPLFLQNTFVRSLIVSVSLILLCGVTENIQSYSFLWVFVGILIAEIRVYDTKRLMNVTS
jgi:hypothetical protein